MLLIKAVWGVLCPVPELLGRARLQSCRECLQINATSAAEVSPFWTAMTFSPACQPKRNLVPYPFRVELAEYQVVTDDEVQQRACADRDDIGNEKRPVESPMQYRHDRQIPQDRHQPCAQVESKQPRQDGRPIAATAFNPCKALVPDEVVDHRRFNCQRRRVLVVETEPAVQNLQGHELYHDPDCPHEIELQPTNHGLFP
jgi:hypothetical protein